MTSPPPLTGLKVLEFAGLAPGPFTGLLLSDHGASVIRIDRPHPTAHTPTPPPRTPDALTRRKTSLALSLKSPRGLTLLRRLLAHTDILIDPFRPGVLEKLGLAPAKLLALNPRLIVARMTGYRRDGKYATMAGHDINYLAVSGVLSMLGAAPGPPQPPGNMLGDFAGGGAVCFMGILLALLHRQSSGKGQVVCANMVDGASYLASFPRFTQKTPAWDGVRGTNLLDGGPDGAPWYRCYETRDRKWMSVGALEPLFFGVLVDRLGLKERSAEWPGPREDRRTWPTWHALFTHKFASKTRAEWEATFDGTDACVAPVLSHAELEDGGYEQRPIVGLSASPAFAVARNRSQECGGGKGGRGGKDAGGESGVEHTGTEGQGDGVEGGGWMSEGLAPGVGGEETVREWVGWRRGVEFEVMEGGLVALDGMGTKSKSKL